MNFGLILLADQNPTNLDLLTESFSAFGFELAVVPDSATTLTESQQLQPDLILLSVSLPELDGFETCRRLKEHDKTKDIPVIFITTSTDRTSSVKGFSVGAVDYVTKPFQLEEVIARVTTHLKIRNLQSQLEETITNLEQEMVERQYAEKALHESMQLTQQINERMQKDLDSAARVQHSLLPDTLPTHSNASFAWAYRPCTELGGDSLNVFQLDDRYVGMYVLDVTGHGVAASLLSVTLSRVLMPRRDPSCLLVQSQNSSHPGSLASPGEVATKLNYMFPMSKEGRQYFTLLYGIFDSHTNRFQYVCAGHPPPVVKKNGHSMIVSDALSVPIGLFEDSEYEEGTIDLPPGSRMYLYSDAVLEARDQDREFFGESRLLNTIQTTQEDTLQKSVDSIVNTVESWSGPDQILDDLSILAIETI